MRIVLLVFARLLTSISYRMIYPFLSAFARGVGVDIPAVTLAVTSRALVGNFGTLLAAFSDRTGRKTGMVAGMAVFSLSLFLVVFWQVYPAFFAAVVLSTLGTYIFLPSLQAYLGDSIPYERRGRIMGLTELNWSLAFIVGIPLVGFLIARSGWISPFILLGGLGLLATALIARFIPGDTPVQKAGESFLPGLKSLLASPSVLAVLAVSLLLTAANETVNLVFGLWMEDSFGLQLAALGATSVVIGVSELGGEGLSSAFVDRVGKKKALAVGLALSSLAALLLPVLGRSTPGALAGLFFFYLTSEFTIVTSIPFVTSVYPAGRGKLMAANLVALALGRAIGAGLGAPLYSIGMPACAAAAAAFNLVALLALRRVKAGE